VFFRKKKYLSSGSLSRLAWQRLMRNNLAITSGIVIILAIIIAILGYSITPDPTPFANEQYLELHTKKPGFKVKMLLVQKNEKTTRTNFIKKMIWGQKSRYIAIPFNGYYFEGTDIVIEEFSDVPSEDPIKLNFSMADVAFALDTDEQVIVDGDNIEFMDINGNPHRMEVTSLELFVVKKHIITKRFILGTDRFGRDVLSQLMIGTRVSLSVGFISVIISLVIGILLGSVAGFFGGRIDDLIVWLINVVWSIPTLLLVIAITFALGKGFWQVFVAVGLTMWVEVARVVRGQILGIREKEFVEAGKALGFPNSRIILYHIIPNVLAPVIVISAANFASAILIEAGLSFLGIGVQPPMPSWGTMIRDNYSYIILDAAYLAILPGIAIMIMVLAFMLLGNALRDALDVRTTT
jgi:peptide/nickel transport system permease protein